MTDRYGQEKIKRFAQAAIDAAQSKRRRPYNASGSLCEYGISPECDAAIDAQAQAANAESLEDEDYLTPGGRND